MPQTLLADFCISLWEAVVCVRLWLTRRRSSTSWNMKRILEEVFFSFIIFSIWAKYWTIRGWRRAETRGSVCVICCNCIHKLNLARHLSEGMCICIWMPFLLYHTILLFNCARCTLAFSKSRSLPMVDNSLHRHSWDSSSWFLSSFTMQSCMITSVSILSLNSSPMNLMLPIERLLAWFFALFSSSTRRFTSSCKGKMSHLSIYKNSHCRRGRGRFIISKTYQNIKQNVVQSLHYGFFTVCGSFESSQSHSTFVYKLRTQPIFQKASLYPCSSIQLLLFLLKDFIVIFVLFKLLLASI